MRRGERNQVECSCSFATGPECRGRIQGTTQYTLQRYTDKFLAQVNLIALYKGRWKKQGLQWLLAVLSSSSFFQGTVIK